MVFVALVAVILAFYAGIFFGIHDCKRTYNIPKGAFPQDVVVTEVDYGTD